MKRIAASIAIAILAAGVRAGEKSAAPVPQAPEKHVVFVNVGAAVPREVFEAAARGACQQLNVRVKTRAAAAPRAAELTGLPEKMAAQLQPDAVLSVFVLNDERACGFLSAPGSWAMVNVRSLKQDNPAPDVYARRVTKLLMKGLAHAAGVGATMEPRCVMFVGSFSLAGIDATSASYGPNAFFPLSETLRRLGGEDLFVSPP